MALGRAMSQNLNGKDELIVEKKTAPAVTSKPTKSMSLDTAENDPMFKKEGVVKENALPKAAENKKTEPVTKKDLDLAMQQLLQKIIMIMTVQRQQARPPVQNLPQMPIDNPMMNNRPMMPMVR